MQWNNTDVNNYATSTIHKYLNETYYNTLPTQDREKLGTKAVREEFHWEQDKGYKQYYGWNSLTANVWLPSVSELVGVAGTQYAQYGTYNSAMQGMNTSVNYYVDKKGGSQFAYFQQFNASGGGQRIWDVCNRQNVWTRSTCYANSTALWFTNGTQRFDWGIAITSLAVHPAVLYNPERPIKQTELLLLCRQMICLFFSIPME